MRMICAEVQDALEAARHASRLPMTRSAPADAVWDQDLPCGPTTAFMELASSPQLPAPSAPMFQSSATGVEPNPASSDDLPARVMAHLAGALAHEQFSPSRGRDGFRARWEDGRELQRSLGRACRLAGLNPRAVVLDDDLDESHEAPVDLQRPLPSADLVVQQLLEVYPLIGASGLLAPELRGRAEYRPALAIGSLLAILEVGDAARSVMYILREQGWAASARWTSELSTLTLGRLIEFLASAPFRVLLGRTLGARRAAQCYARLMPRLIPGLCRKLLLAHVLWLMHEQLRTAPTVTGTSLQSSTRRPSLPRAVQPPTPCAYLL
jgi:hypothetical protein